MKNYTYEQFLQLYDYANEKVREQIQKKLLSFFYDLAGRKVESYFTCMFV